MANWRQTPTRGWDSFPRCIVCPPFLLSKQWTWSGRLGLSPSEWCSATPHLILYHQVRCLLHWYASPPLPPKTIQRMDSDLCDHLCYPDIPVSPQAARTHILFVFFTDYKICEYWIFCSLRQNQYLMKAEENPCCTLAQSEHILIIDSTKNICSELLAEVLRESVQSASTYVTNLEAD